MEWLKRETAGNLHTAQHQPEGKGTLVKVSETCYQDLFNNASDAIFIRDLKGNIIEANEAAVTLTGYTHNELTGMNASEFLTTESFKLVMKKQKALLGDESATQRYELEIIRKDGVRMNAESQTSLLTHNGRPIGVQCIVRDITERKRVEEALQESEERYRTVADFTYDWEYWRDSDGDLRYISPACERMTGYRVDEFLQDPKLLDRIIHHDDYPVIAQHINAEFNSKEALHVDFRITSRSGEERWISHWCQPVYGNDGSWLGRRGSNRDITERKRVEEALRASEEGFRNIYEESPIGIELYDCDGILLTTNGACLDIFGALNVAEVQGFKLFEDPNVTDEVKQRLRRGETVRYEAPFSFEKVKKHKLYNTSKSGIIQLDVLITPLDMEGEKHMGGYLAQIQDITERKWAENALRESEQNFRNSLDNSPLGIRIITAEGELLYANQAILNIYGYSSIEELKATPIKERYTPESHAEYQERKERRKRGKPVPASYEIRIVRKNGEVRHLAVSRKEVIWNGETQFQSLYEDITKRKQAETALRQSEEFTSSLLINSPNPILVLNADASIRYVNPALEKLTGFSSAELVGGKPPYPWWIEGTHEALGKRLAKVMCRGGRKCEQLFRKKGGEYFWVEMAFKRVEVDGEFKHLLVNWIDLTEQKRLRENTQLYVSEITRAQEEERKRIAREIHDESLQSLSALALDIDAIAKDKERLPEDIIQHLGELRAETNSMLEGLRNFSHELRPGVLDVGGLVPALEILTEELNKSGKINASLQIEGPERRLRPEPELVLFRIAQGALHNVRMHSEATETLMRLKFTRGKARLTVSDSGRGFELPRVLGDLAAEGKLGIIGMQERTRLLGGKFSVKSRVGRGTTVVVEVADVGRSMMS